MSPDDIQRAQEEIRSLRVLEWKRNWCEENDVYRNVRTSPYRVKRLPDISAAPEPTDEDLSWPDQMLSVYWDTGYITITLDALKKLPVSQRNKIYKLGGMKP